MVISAKTKVGIVKEASWGAGGSPAKLLPVSPPTFTEPYEQVLDNALRGIPAADFAAYQGMGRIEGSLEGGAYPEELGYFLFAIMGAKATSGTAAPYTHVFTLAATPPSLSIQVEDDVQDVRYNGIYVSELGLTYNAAEGMLTYSASLVGKDRVETSGTPIPQDTTKPPFMGWQTKVYMGGAVVGELTEGEITLSREVALFWGADGLSVPSQAHVGPLSVTGRATVKFDDIAFYNRYKNKTQDEFKIEWTYGTGSDLKKLTFRASKMDYGEGAAEIDRTGVYISLAYSLRALYNETDGGPCWFELQNAQSDY